MPREDFTQAIAQTDWLVVVTTPAIFNVIQDYFVLVSGLVFEGHWLMFKLDDKPKQEF